MQGMDTEHGREVGQNMGQQAGQVSGMVANITLDDPGPQVAGQRPAELRERLARQLRAAGRQRGAQTLDEQGRVLVLARRPAGRRQQLSTTAGGRACRDPLHRPRAVTTTVAALCAFQGSRHRSLALAAGPARWLFADQAERHPPAIDAVRAACLRSGPRHRIGGWHGRRSSRCRSSAQTPTNSGDAGQVCQDGKETTDQVITLPPRP